MAFWKGEPLLLLLFFFWNLCYSSFFGYTFLFLSFLSPFSSSSIHSLVLVHWLHNSIVRFSILFFFSGYVGPLCPFLRNDRFHVALRGDLLFFFLAPKTVETRPGRCGVYERHDGRLPDDHHTDAPHKRTTQIPAAHRTTTENGAQPRQATRPPKHAAKHAIASAAAA